MITFIYALVVLLISCYGFIDDKFYNRCSFSPSLMKGSLIQTWVRWAVYSYVHVDWLHLIMNLIVFIILGYQLEKKLSADEYLNVIFITMWLVVLFSFIFHLNSKNYHSVGISGVTSCFMTLGLFICPSWIFYMVAGSTFAGYFFGKKDWIAQEVHISGYVLGLVFGLLFNILPL